MYIPLSPELDTPISLTPHNTIHYPISIVGNPSLTTEHVNTRYNFYPEDFTVILHYLLRSKNPNTIQIRGKMFDYARHTLHGMYATTIHIPPTFKLELFLDYLSPIQSENGEIDIDTLTEIQKYIVKDLYSDESHFHIVSNNDYLLIKRHFKNPVMIRRNFGSQYSIRNGDCIFEFLDVLAAILNHRDIKEQCPVTRDRIFRITDLTPLRIGLDEETYKRYLNFYDILRSVTYDNNKFLRPMRILVGSQYEFVAVPQKTFRVEFNTYSTLQNLKQDDTLWSDQMHFTDIHPSNVDEQEINQWLQSSQWEQQHCTVQGNTIHFSGEIGDILSRMKTSRDITQRDMYYSKCLRLSLIFQTPLLLFQLPPASPVINLGDITMQPLANDYIIQRNNFRPL